MLHPPILRAMHGQAYLIMCSEEPDNACFFVRVDDAVDEPNLTTVCQLGLMRQDKLEIVVRLSNLQKRRLLRRMLRAWTHHHGTPRTWCLGGRSLPTMRMSRKRVLGMDGWAGPGWPAW